MTKNNVEPRIGENGYYYFTYNLNAKYAVSTSSGTAFYEITECIYREGNQYYGVHVYAEDIDSQREISIQRLNYIFSTARELSIMNNGTEEELPLTKSEVELYYKRFVAARNKRKREANGKLKEDKDYQKLVSEEKEITPQLVRAIFKESADEEALAQKINEITAKKREKILSLGIKPSDLTAPETCKTCKDKGITPKGNICACAWEQNAKIKAYCAAERLVSKRKEEQMDEET